jgi:hypothetical protein
MLFDYYEIEPEVPDHEWRRVLSKNHAAFIKGASWG